MKIKLISDKWLSLFLSFFLCPFLYMTTRQFNSTRGRKREGNYNVPKKRKKEQTRLKFQTAWTLLPLFVLVGHSNGWHGIILCQTNLQHLFRYCLNPVLYSLEEVTGCKFVFRLPDRIKTRPFTWEVRMLVLKLHFSTEALLNL